jgi:proteasome assembly chaperone (PAC2) family protein
MGVMLYEHPELRDPVMLCGWAGIGNVGLVAVSTMRRLLHAEEFGEIEPYEYFEPSKVVVRDGLIEDMRFPSTRFFAVARHSSAVAHGDDAGTGGPSAGGQGRQTGEGDWATRDLVLLVGEQQPGDEQKAYEMAGRVLDVAEQIGCRRIYTSAASVTMIHHTAKPRVWAVPNTPALLSEVRQYGNTVLMSEVGDRDGEGLISGLNGVLLGVAANRGIEAVCLMGEVPYYLQGAPWPYPKASISILEVLARIFGVRLDLRELHQMAGKVEANVEQVLDALAAADELPEQVRTEMERLRQGKHPDLGPITEREKKEILEHIDDLFKGESSDEA